MHGGTTALRTAWHRQCAIAARIEGEAFGCTTTACYGDGGIVFHRTDDGVIRTHPPQFSGGRRHRVNIIYAAISRMGNQDRLIGLNQTGNTVGGTRRKCQHLPF